jgi:hypothetical protein
VEQQRGFKEQFSFFLDKEGKIKLGKTQLKINTIMLYAEKIDPICLKKLKNSFFCCWY